MKKTTIGERIRGLRELSMMDQRQAAETMGIDYIHYCQIENDETLPTIEDKLRISLYYHKSEKEIFQ